MKLRVRGHNSQGLRFLSKQLKVTHDFNQLGPAYKMTGCGCIGIKWVITNAPQTAGLVPELSKTCTETLNNNGVGANNQAKEVGFRKYA